ncbi:hypothetical protein B0H13DRAFT_2277444 [Mycena leptocephala]|nr:hypothetical protein B0H13DRAFT_2277444 [Mycena leptocephala]
MNGYSKQAPRPQTARGARRPNPNPADPGLTAVGVNIPGPQIFFPAVSFFGTSPEFSFLVLPLTIASSIKMQQKDTEHRVVIETRTPPHIKHKQEAVSPIQSFSSSRPKLARSLPRPLTGRTLPTCSKHDGRLLWCLLYLHSLCRCRGKGAGADDDDFDPMKFPAANSAFTPDGERIHPYTSSLPMQVRASPHPQPEPPMDNNADPFAPLPPPPHVVAAPPPDYSASVRDGLQSDSEQPLGLGYRPMPTQGPGPENRSPPPLRESTTGERSGEEPRP